MAKKIRLSKITRKLKSLKMSKTKKKRFLSYHLYF